MFGNTNWGSSIIGVNNDYLEVRDWPLSSGRMFDAGELAGIVERAAERVLNQEIVERHPVARGVDARVDDVAASQVNRAGNAVEQPRMVCGEHHHQRATHPSHPAGANLQGIAAPALQEALDKGPIQTSVV